MSFNMILVACDFRPESFTALLHAVTLAERSTAGLLLLHLTSAPDEDDDATKKMILLQDELKKHFQGDIRTLVREGDIMDIGKIADQEQCTLVVMPTHGMQGMQQFTGSLALTVVSESRIPFFIVQPGSVAENGYRRIVIPVEFRKELLDEAGLFVKVAKMFSSEVYLVSNARSAPANDDHMLSDLREKFTSEGITVHMDSSNKFDFSKAVAEYAASVKADLICAVNFARETLYAVTPRTDEEDLIYNKAGISVLLITPEEKEEDVKEPLWE